jgi:hypothetical protein
MAEPFPFIVARGRSGTTLLRAMLNAHPDMAVPPESHFVVPMLRRRRRLEARGHLLIDDFVADLSGRYGFRRWGLDVRDVEGRLRSSGSLTLPDAIREVFGVFAERHGKGRYAEKTPINVLHIPLLARTFSEARFVHVIRDGRDVALSYLDADFGSGSIPEAALYWRRFVRKGMRSGARLLPDRYLEVRYEHLVAEPETVLRSVCEFLDLGFHPVMLRYHERADDLLRTTSHSEHHSRIALPPTQGLRNWRREMDPDALAMFEAIAGDLLDELGYERGAPIVTRRTRREAQREVAALTVRRARDRIGRVTRHTRMLREREGSSRGRSRHSAAIRCAAQATKERS